VHFTIIYTIEAHPTGPDSPYFNRESLSSYSTDEEGNPVYQPMTYEERLELARKTAADEKIDMPVLVDEIDNPVWCTYGPAPNIAYLIGTEGRIITKQGWYNPEQMESAIQAYIGND